MQSQSVEGQEQIQFVSSYPSMGQRDQCQYEGASQAPSTSQRGRRSRSTTRFAGREFGSGWVDDVLPLPPAWTFDSRLS